MTTLLFVGVLLPFLSSLCWFLLFPILFSTIFPELLLSSIYSCRFLFAVRFVGLLSLNASLSSSIANCLLFHIAPKRGSLSTFAFISLPSTSIIANYPLTPLMLERIPNSQLASRFLSYFSPLFCSLCSFLTSPSISISSLHSPPLYSQPLATSQIIVYQWRIHA